MVSEPEISSESVDEGPEVKGKRSNKTREPSVRKCLLTQERLPKEEMVRFVLSPDRELVPDLKAVLPGRGMWISASADILRQALKRGFFAKAAKGKVIFSEDLVSRVENLLVRRCVEHIARANRAGRAILGFEKVREALRKEGNGVSGLILAASDAAEDGRRKISKLATVKTVAVVESLTAEELAMAFGRERTVHVYISERGLTDGLKTDMTRLAGFRSAGTLERPKEEG